MPFWKRLSLSTSFSYLILRLFAPIWARNTGHVLTVFYAFVFSSLCLYVFHVLLYPHFLSPFRHVPEPSGASFFIGHFTQVITHLDGSYYRRWLKETPNDGLIKIRDLFNQVQLMPTNAAALADVLVHRCYDFEKPEVLRRGSTLAILGDGLLFAEGDVHKSWDILMQDVTVQTQRKSLMPAFAYRHIKDLQSIFWSKSVSMIHAIEAQQQPTSSSSSETPTNRDQAIAEPNDWSSRATLDIIGAAALGCNFNSLNDPSNELNRSYRALFRADATAILFGILEAIFPPRIINSLPVRRNRNWKKNVRLVRELCAKMIGNAKREIEERQQNEKDRLKQTPINTHAADDMNVPDHNSMTTQTDTQTSSRKTQTILSIALTSTHYQFTTNELIGQLTTFLVAGHETTAAAVAWSIYNLCKYPEMQAKLREEVRRVIPAKSFRRNQDDVGGAGANDKDDFDNGSLPTNLDLTTNLPYLMAFTSEILRLYTPVPGTIRQAARDTMIAGHFVPKGTHISLMPWAINVQSDLWSPSGGQTKSDALRFKPERWLETSPPHHDPHNDEDYSHDGAVPSNSTTTSGGRGGAKSNYANLTFLHGPRSCIGQSFARSELACLLAAWVGYFHTDFEEETARKEAEGQKKLKDEKMAERLAKKKDANVAQAKKDEEEVDEEYVGIGVDMMNGLSAKPAEGWKVVCRVVKWE